MLLNTHKKILIVGLGLMGGSYAKALHKTGFTVYAIDRDRESIDFAKEEGFIDKGDTEASEALIGEADIIIFALYPKLFKPWVEKNQKYMKSGAYITDVTGVKGCIVESIQEILRDDLEFISSHPMAGRELSGVKNSDETIFYGANYIIVPTEKNTKEGIDICREIGLIMRFGKITILSPEEHDEMIGFVSQLTHCIAVSLMNVSDDEKLSDYVGDSFRDLTRIAKINENMWTELFLMNKEALLKEMDKFIYEIQDLRERIATEDEAAIKEKMIISAKRRRAFDKRR